MTAYAKPRPLHFSLLRYTTEEVRLDFFFSLVLRGPTASSEKPTVEGGEIETPLSSPLLMNNRQNV